MKLSGILLTSDGKSIAYHHYKAGHRKLVVIVHGFYNSKDSIPLQKLKDDLLVDYDVFMFDLRGHGKSSGTFSWTAKEGKDLEAVFNYIGDYYDKIGLIGFSLGASICINAISKQDLVDSFICVSGVSDVGRVDYRFWDLDWEGDFVYTMISSEGRRGKGVRPGPFWLRKEKPIKNIARIKVPVLYIHGDRDWVIRPWRFSGRKSSLGGATWPSTASVPPGLSSRYSSTMMRRISPMGCARPNK